MGSAPKSRVGRSVRSVSGRVGSRLVRTGAERGSLVGVATSGAPARRPALPRLKPLAGTLFALSRPGSSTLAAMRTLSGSQRPGESAICATNGVS